MAEPKPKLRPKFGRMFFLTFFLCLCIVMSDLISSRTRKLVNLICLLLLQIVFNYEYYFYCNNYVYYDSNTNDVRRASSEYKLLEYTNPFVDKIDIGIMAVFLNYV